MQRYNTILCLDTKYDISSDIYKKYFETAAEVQITKDIRNAIFSYRGDGSFWPISGDMLVNYEGVNFESTHDPQNPGYIAIKNYTWQELLDAIPNDAAISLFFNKNISGQDLFDKEEKSIIIDYSETITYLENVGIVDTKISENWLTTDGRVFRFWDFNPDEWWEVDILGTPYGAEITTKIVEIFVQAQKLGSMKSKYEPGLKESERSDSNIVLHDLTRKYVSA